MTLQDLLSEKRQEILSEWFDEAVKSYPANTAAFLREQKNQFANPVGQTIFSGLGHLLDGLQKDEAGQEATAFLDTIIRIRAVQDLTPSQAVSFLGELKGIVRNKAASSGAARELGDELVVFESRVDRLLLTAFDIFMQCKEKLYDIKANEVRNMTFRILQRANALNGACEQEKGLEGSTTL